MSKPADAKAVFQDVREVPPAERSAFLDAACGGDPAVRARVEALLAADERAGSFLASPTGGASGDSAPHEQLGTVIGHYKLQQQIGEGGFGTVWMAEQQQPVRRQVALKIVKRGMDTRSVVARFEQERQALAMMDHPNIAKVFDGGETPAGRPYFAMELVRGVPITTFCDQRHLDTRERLALFVLVCQAVQHAHQKGIIHRDLKPSNVLVTLHDGVPVPKVIDFGVAKAVHGPLTEKTLFTEFRQMVGTPEYMSPEQAELSGLDVDTRADIYSLGVLLYELLTGTLPFDAKTLAQKGLLELLRAIREDEPQKPSTRVSTPGASSAEMARRRRTDARRLGTLLRGDLDWVVMKAMEKDRGRRYATPAELAADIGRHLADEPVAARPPSLVYQLQKLARRRRGAVAAALALLVTLAAGVSGTLWFAIEARRRLAEYEQMETVVLWEQAVAAEAGLDPAGPERLPAMRAWLAAHQVLVDRRPRVAATLRDLEARARPASAAELEQDRQQHPKLPLVADLAADVAGERRAQAVRGGAAPMLVELTAEERAWPPRKLGQMAWDRVAPGAERTQHGEEERGLALAQAALAAPETPDAPRRSLLDTLAWALFANGRDTEAVAASQAALAAAPAEQRLEYEGMLQRLQQRVASVAGAGGGAWLARREDELEALTAEVATRRTFRFDSPADQFLYETLHSLPEKLDSLAAGPAVAVEQRVRWAQRIDDLTPAHPLAPASWSEAAAAIAAADGQRASTEYRGCGIVLTPQRGLVPIGMNPSTKLWEFYDLRSAWDGQVDPATLPIPRYAPDDSLPITPASGIVFVLLPGGRAAIGAQRDDPTGANYDREAVPAMGPVRVHVLAPFFLARHEMTQGQWARLWNGDPAMRRPSHFGLGYNAVGAQPLNTGLVTDLNPVESVSWPMCAQLLARHALALPTEAQWEYACRAGSTGPWWCAQADLVRHANLADATASAFNAEWEGFEAWNDGCLLHVAVGHFRPNAFGMHDMHGNVYEWCADGRSGTHGPDGERETGTAARGICGGAFDSKAEDARSAFRRQPPLQSRSPNLGLRAARPLR